MKFTKASVGVLVILCRKKLSRIDILEEMKKVTGRDMKIVTLMDSLDQLLLTELVSTISKSKDESNNKDKDIVYFAITASGREILKSIKSGFLKRGRVG